MPADSSPSITASRPRARHALQIEINRALYMDERTLDRRPGFEALARDLIEALGEVMPDVAAALGVGPAERGLAAE